MKEAGSALKAELVIPLVTTPVGDAKARMISSGAINVIVYLLSYE
jgi:hypothetical protein